jgi:hypothetical protein
MPTRFAVTADHDAEPVRAVETLLVDLPLPF